MKIKIHHKFRNMVLHSCWSMVFLCVVSVFILFVFAFKILFRKRLWKNKMEKKNKKKKPALPQQAAQPALPQPVSLPPPASAQESAQPR